MARRPSVPSLEAGGPSTPTPAFLDSARCQSPFLQDLVVTAKQQVLLSSPDRPVAHSEPLVHLSVV